MNSYKIEQLEKGLRIEKSNIFKKNNEIYIQFQTKINKLISETPTGELRNDLTDLNILFSATIINNEILMRI